MNAAQPLHREPTESVPDAALNLVMTHEVVAEERGYDFPAAYAAFKAVRDRLAELDRRMQRCTDAVEEYRLSDEMAAHDDDINRLCRSMVGALTRLTGLSADQIVEVVA